MGVGVCHGCRGVSWKKGGVMEPGSCHGTGV